MKFICPEHGEIKAVNIRYSCPALGNCPECNMELEDVEGGIRVMEEKEAVLIRPSYYKEYHPKIYEKYKDEIED